MLDESSRTGPAERCAEDPDAVRSPAEEASWLAWVERELADRPFDPCEAPLPLLEEPEHLRAESMSESEVASWLAALERDLDDDGPLDPLRPGDPPVASVATAGSGAAPGTQELRALLDVPPSPHVVVRLVALQDAGLTAHDQVLALRLWERVGSWTAARTARTLRAVVPELAPPLVGRLRRDELEARAGFDGAVLEVGAALRLSTGQVRHRLAEAHLLHDAPATLAALESGAVSQGHTRALLDALAPLPPGEQRDAVEGDALAVAAQHTVRATRASAQRLVAQADPTAAATRERDAASRRDVHLVPQPDGMADLVAHLRAPDALRLHDALRQAARRTDPDDPRTAGQRRADTLVALLTATTDGAAGGVTGSPTGGVTGTRSGGRRGDRRTIGVVVAATALAGNDDGPAHLNGYGPLSADQARRLAADADLVRLLVEPTSGRLLDLGRTRYEPTPELRDHVQHRDRTCRAPHCDAPAARCELDHRQPWGDDGHTVDTNLDDCCPAHHRAKDHGGWTLRRNPDHTTTWTSPTGHTSIVAAPTYAEHLPAGAGPPGISPPGDGAPGADPPSAADRPDPDDVPPF